MYYLGHFPKQSNLYTVTLQPTENTIKIKAVFSYIYIYVKDNFLPFLVKFSPDCFTLAGTRSV